MELCNELTRTRDEPGPSRAWSNALRTLVVLLAPFAPHFAEELWEILGEPYSIHRVSWPTYDPSVLDAADVSLVVQLNGKFKGTVSTMRGLTEAQAHVLAATLESVQRSTEGRHFKRLVYVPDRIINLIYD